MPCEAISTFGSWPLLAPTLILGWVLGRVRPLNGLRFWRHHSELVESGGQLGCRQRVRR